MLTIRQAITILFVGLCITASAQKRVTLGVSGGIGSSNIINYPFNYSPSGSARVAIGTDIKIIKPVYVNMEFVYGSFSNQYKAGNNSSLNRFYTIDIPVAVKLKIGPDIFKPYYSFGVGPTFLIGGRSQTIISGSKNDNVIDISASGFNSPFISMYNTLGFEIKAGKILPFVELKHQYSLTPINANNTDWKMRNLTVSLGFKF